MENTFENFEQEMDVFLDEFKRLKKEFTQEAKSKLNRFIEIVFETSPDINAIIWTQYTPYFNDGDPCEFSVNDPFFTNAIYEDDIDECSFGYYDGSNSEIWCETLYEIDKREKNINKAILKKFCQFQQSDELCDVLKDVFEDHSKVIAVRGKEIEIKSYDHD